MVECRQWSGGLANTCGEGLSWHSLNVNHHRLSIDQFDGGHIESHQKCSMISTWPTQYSVDLNGFPITSFHWIRSQRKSKRKSKRRGSQEAKGKLREFKILRIWCVFKTNSIEPTRRKRLFCYNLFSNKKRREVRNRGGLRKSQKSRKWELGIFNKKRFFWFTFESDSEGSTEHGIQGMEHKPWSMEHKATSVLDQCIGPILLVPKAGRVWISILKILIQFTVL